MVVSEKGKGIVYPDYLQSVIERIGILSTEMQPPSFFSQYNDIIPVLFDHLNNVEISQSTYRLVWRMLNRIVVAGNLVWFKQYWAWAVQYETFRFQGDKRTESYISFFFFHLMVGALLCFNKRYDWLSEILFYSPQQPERFGLIPNAFQEIIDEAEMVYKKGEQVFFFESYFQFEGLGQGVRNDSIIRGSVYEYLALLMIRLWSIDSNVSFTDPKSIPSLDQRNMDRNEVLKRVAETLKRKVVIWYGKNRINEVELRVIPNEREVTDLLDSLIGMADKQNETIYNESDLDEGKVRKLMEDIIDSAKRKVGLLPTKEMSAIDPSRTQSNDNLLKYDYRIEPILLMAGKSISYTNLPDVLMDMLVRQATGYYEQLFIQQPAKFEYRIRYEDIGRAIEKLALSPDYVILSFGEFIDSPMGVPVVNFVSRMSCIIVILKDQLPYTEYVTKEQVKVEGLIVPDVRDILPDGTHLYSNVASLKKDEILSLVQYLRIYSSQQLMKYIRLNVDHFSLQNMYDLDDIKPVG